MNQIAKTLYRMSLEGKQWPFDRQSRGYFFGDALTTTLQVIISARQTNEQSTRTRETPKDTCPQRLARRVFILGSLFLLLAVSVDDKIKCIETVTPAAREHENSPAMLQKMINVRTLVDQDIHYHETEKPIVQSLFKGRSIYAICTQ